TRRKRRRRTGIASGETAFFVLRPLGSRYCLRNFLGSIRQTSTSNIFHAKPRFFVVEEREERKGGEQR
ncbi:MAG: hypothetical protein ACLP2X_21640, partial [Syntrophobacteraceae bacterium]